MILKVLVVLVVCVSANYYKYDSCVTLEYFKLVFIADRWREVTINGDSPSPRFSMVSGVSGKYFYISTGEGKNNVFFNDIWRFNLE